MKPSVSLVALVEDLSKKFAGLGVSPSRADFLRFLQNWLRSTIHDWDQGAVRRYGLGFYVLMDISQYPVSESEVNPVEEMRAFRAAPPLSADMFASVLGDMFWRGVTVLSNVMCPRCRSSLLRKLQDPEARSVVLGCDLCAWAQRPDGAAWKGSNSLVPATIRLLKEPQ